MTALLDVGYTEVIRTGTGDVRIAASPTTRLQPRLAIVHRGWKPLAREERTLAESGSARRANSRSGRLPSSWAAMLQGLLVSYNHGALRKHVSFRGTRSNPSSVTMHPRRV